MEFVQYSSVVACKNRKEKTGYLSKLISLGHEYEFVFLKVSHLLIDALQYSDFCSQEISTGNSEVGFVTLLLKEATASVL